MALTADQLRAQRDAIIASLSRPEEQRFGDRMVRNRSLVDAEAAIKRLDAEIAIAVGAEIATTGKVRSRITRIQTSRGY